MVTKKEIIEKKKNELKKLTKKIKDKKAEKKELSEELSNKVAITLDGVMIESNRPLGEIEELSLRLLKKHFNRSKNVMGYVG